MARTAATKNKDKSKKVVDKKSKGKAAEAASQVADKDRFSQGGMLDWQHATLLLR